MGGTSETEDGGWPTDDRSRFSERRCSFFLRQASHSPVGPVVPPQPHFRCKRPLRTGVKVGGALDEALAWVWRVALIVGVLRKRRERLGCRSFLVWERRVGGKPPHCGAPSEQFLISTAAAPA